jgi:hypothetical protein
MNEDQRLDEAFKNLRIVEVKDPQGYAVIRHEIQGVPEAKQALKQLLIDARLDELSLLPSSELGKLANHSLKVDLHVEDRISQLTNSKEE